MTDKQDLSRVSILRGKCGSEGQEWGVFKMNWEESEGWVGCLREKVEENMGEEVGLGDILQEMEQSQVGEEARPRILVHHYTE